jgi:hypothetical protein
MFAAVNIDRMPAGAGAYPAALQHCRQPCGHRALHGVLSYLYLPAGRRKNDAVTFLTWVKALHFTMKQSEQNEKITKNNMDFLVAFT